MNKLKNIRNIQTLKKHTLTTFNFQLKKLEASPKEKHILKKNINVLC